MRISDWSSDVCSSDLVTGDNRANFILTSNHKDAIVKTVNDRRYCVLFTAQQSAEDCLRDSMTEAYFDALWKWLRAGGFARTEEHTSELQSLMRRSYAVFCLKKKKLTKEQLKQLQTHAN